MKLNELNYPIDIPEGIGQDDVTEGPMTEKMIVVPASLAIHNVYADGSLDHPGITDPELFKHGIGTSSKIYATERVVEKLLQLDANLREISGNQLVVTSGFISPQAQHKKWQEKEALYRKEPKEVGVYGRFAEEILAGRDGDVGGSVAPLGLNDDDPRLMGAISDLLKNEEEQLKYVAKKLEGDDSISTLQKLAKEILMYRANRGLIDLPVNIYGAKSVHNLGRSVNVVTKPIGSDNVNFTGAGLDLDSPLQKVDFFNNPNYYSPFIEQAINDRALQRMYEAAFGKKIYDLPILPRREIYEVIAAMAKTRAELVKAVLGVVDKDGQRFFDLYLGETGHITGQGSTNRKAVYAQVAELELWN